MRSTKNNFSTKTLYVTDLDGTLLDDDAQLSGTTRESILQIIAERIPFTIATARAIQSTRPVFEGVELALPVVTFNGAFISDLRDGSYELIHQIGGQYVESILDIGRSHNLVPFVSSNDGTADHLYFPVSRNEGMEHYLSGRTAAQDPRLTEASSSDRFRSEQIVCFTFIDRLSTVQSVKAEIEAAECDVAISLFENRYSPDWYWLMVRDAQANKGATTRELMSRYGLTEYRLVTFGDEMNDMDLIIQADHGVAVANGVEELKAAASEVIGPNIEDSVCRYILANSI